MVSLLERYTASMVLSGVGDALGYKCGEFEFCHSGPMIHQTVHDLGGLESIHVKLPDWSVSDDTVMHLATARALGKLGDYAAVERTELFHELARQYKECMNHMAGRSPGATCGWGARTLKPGIVNGHHIPFDDRGGGCGAAMRAMCIGLRFPKVVDVDELVAVSVESGRMTHHHPTGYLGSLAAALFTSFAIQGKPLKEWGVGLLTVLPKALHYIESTGHEVENNKKSWGYFLNAWTLYLKTRGILDGISDPKFPDDYGVSERDVFYKSLSYSGWAGASGHDAPMIAYDALLGAGHDWFELCSRSMFHSGDSDSTGVIAAACYGAMYGFTGVSQLNYMNVEFGKELSDLGSTFYKLNWDEVK